MAENNGLPEGVTLDQVLNAFVRQYGVPGAAGQMPAGMPSASMGTPSAFGATTPPAMAASGGIPSPDGWSVPLELNINGSIVTVYFHFPANTTGQAAQIVTMLLQNGYPVKYFQPRNNGGWGGNNGGYGGWGRGGGGYGRR